MQTPKQDEVLSPYAHFKDDFYRDGFQTILLSLGMQVSAIGLLILVSLYFFLHQVLPVTFPVYADWRVQAEVPAELPYLQAADLIQWSSTAMSTIFVVDFLNYSNELKERSHYFTTQGYESYLAALKVFMGQEEVTKQKEFVRAKLMGAPVIINQGLLNGKYSWWVQMPVDVLYSGVEGANHSLRLNVQMLVVRVSTLNNLDGVAIDNLVVTQG